jgi:hypothetical protein
VTTAQPERRFDQPLPNGITILQLGAWSVAITLWRDAQPL